MAAKRKLPRNAKRLPKGTTKDDYDPEVYAEWQRDRWRQRQEVHRNKQRRGGYRDVTFALSREAREQLAALAKERKQAKGIILNQLIMETRNEPTQLLPDEQRPAAGADEHALDQHQTASSAE